MMELLTLSVSEQEVEIPEIDYTNIVVEDDQPVDGLISEREMDLLRDSLYASWRMPDGTTPQFVAMANVGLFYLPTEPAVVPDLLVSLDVQLPAQIKEKKDKSYFIWQYGKPPELVVEIVSNREGGELGRKVKLYARLGISYYIVHDPEHHLSETTLHIFERRGKSYFRMSEQFLEELNLGVTLWQGVHKGMQGEWLRWVNDSGQLLATNQERAEVAETQAETAKVEAEAAKAEAEAAKNRAEKLAAKLRALGIDPESLDS